MLKIHRVFIGGYQPNYDRLREMGYAIVRLHKPIITALNADQGLGQIKGTTKKVGANYSPVPVCIFKRSNRQLLWETTSKADGSYAFRNIAVGLECFVVAFDPDEEYNAVISDKVVAK
ncbi:carboxypeptidase regulatory-like domain-containing protein [Acinetobacter sp. FDAARGOS_724]|uniref:carboxypeptidase regulatory-like domain-containing protein n=1 Tax=Acinetobacter sp. FDAARGOS_724 TaxID=2545797 RepID=UPI00158D3FF5|nr:carboxypeptidase regulatory-like domain-containing protein [Acinetobacter sp. FDAARGOS_724]QKW83379.1 carboxypeptidase regulatory-like domain-containing protein [Acinetobacter sp. FDAARGOS_724]